MGSMAFLNACKERINHQTVTTPGGTVIYHGNRNSPAGTVSGSNSESNRERVQVRVASSGRMDPAVCFTRYNRVKRDKNVL